MKTNKTINILDTDHPAFTDAADECRYETERKRSDGG
jgi:hypothetical protein